MNFSVFCTYTHKQYPLWYIFYEVSPLIVLSWLWNTITVGKQAWLTFWKIQLVLNKIYSLFRCLLLKFLCFIIVMQGLEVVLKCICFNFTALDYSALHGSQLEILTEVYIFQVDVTWKFCVWYLVCDALYPWNLCLIQQSSRDRYSSANLLRQC